MLPNRRMRVSKFFGPGPGPGPGRLHFDGFPVPPVSEVLHIPSVGGLAGKVAVPPAVALPGVVDLVAFVLVVSDGVPSCFAVTSDNALHLPLPSPVEEPNDGGQHGECHHEAEHPGRGRAMDIDQGVRGVVFCKPTPSYLGIRVDICETFHPPVQVV